MQFNNDFDEQIQQKREINQFAYDHEYIAWLGERIQFRDPHVISSIEGTEYVAGQAQGKNAEEFGGDVEDDDFQVDGLCVFVEPVGRFEFLF